MMTTMVVVVCAEITKVITSLAHTCSPYFRWPQTSEVSPSPAIIMSLNSYSSALSSAQSLYHCRIISLTLPLLSLTLTLSHSLPPPPPFPFPFLSVSHNLPLTLSLPSSLFFSSLPFFRHLDTSLHNAPQSAPLYSSSRRGPPSSSPVLLSSPNPSAFQLHAVLACLRCWRCRCQRLRSLALHPTKGKRQRQALLQVWCKSLLWPCQVCLPGRQCAHAKFFLFSPSLLSFGIPVIAPCDPRKTPGLGRIQNAFQWVT